MRRRNIRKFIILILILCISIGFAVITASLIMNASFSFTNSSFDLHFSNINVLSTSTVTSPTATITDSTTINYSGTFNKPGDYIDFSFYIVNGGTIDGQISQINTNLTSEQANYITYSLKYEIEKTNVGVNDYVYAGQSRKVIAHFEYKEDIDDFIDLSNLNLNLTMNFIQPQTVTTTVWNYEYSGTEQYFIVPKTGKYKLEVWGASGGGVDGYYGYGGYSRGTISLNKNQKLYLYVGGQGKTGMDNPNANLSLITGGWNGGGSAYLDKQFGYYNTGSGGGSTDIRTIRADVTYQNYSYYTNDTTSLNSRIIVAGGGGGEGHDHTDGHPVSSGGHGGGYIGVGVTSAWEDSHTHPLGGTQSSITFGYGASPVMTSTTDHLDAGNNSSFCSGGGGGGYYGGEASIYQGCRNFGGAGGSGYIGNTSLTSKIMYCYNCQESTEEANETNIKTRSTTDVSSIATANYAKNGNGYAKITFTG
ncbi:MAG: glycine rich domain-containing protein [Bacilli bacterium]|nr:glycine rich domain-containing protein [Bacilli bacterium]